jgi:SAM-dependent methyltransferase
MIIKSLLLKISYKLNQAYTRLIDKIFPFTKDVLVKDQNFEKRNYKNYRQYLSHQQKKFFFLREGMKNDYHEYLKKFKEEFANISHLSSNFKNVLCIGARGGAEVEALRQFGFAAVGIDVAFPKNNKFVHYGEFEDIPYPKESFDIVYTNSLDHVHNVDNALKEINRVLKKTGYFIPKIILGSDEGFAFAGPSYESFEWKKRDEFLNYIIKSQNFIFKNKYNINKEWDLFILKKNEMDA